MIDYISGTLVEKSPERVLVDLGGVGISLLVSFNTYQELGPVGSQVKLLTYLHYREPTFELYGFSRPEERDVFLLLIQVSGVGVKVARTILSGMRPRDVRRAIIDNDIACLSAVPGIGRKTAERLVVFLRDKAMLMAVPSEPLAGAGGELERDASAALVALGIPANNAQQVVRKALKTKGDSVALDELVKEALRLLF
ncbi:MAG: Holliday junction branch migration protein RuvA [Candidatus Coatesbacteria bacterium]|nr:Holliday junction branch migration protein RuvA [Candidatus Coatesbacteria bacterium]